MDVDFSYFLHILKCPITNQPLKIINKDLLDNLNQKIRKGLICSLDGKIQRNELEEALSNEKGNFIYPVVDGIPWLTASNAFAMLNLFQKRSLVGYINRLKRSFESGKLYEEMTKFHRLAAGLLNVSMADDDYLGTPKEIALPIIDLAIKNLNPNEIVLDVGSGRGLWSEHMAKKNFSIVSFDISHNLVKECRERLKNINTESKAMVCVADCTKMPFIDSSFNGIYSILTWRLSGNIDHSLNESFRTLKRGGICVGTVAMDNIVYRIQRVIRSISKIPFALKCYIAIGLAFIIWPFYALKINQKQKTNKSTQKLKYLPWSRIGMRCCMGTTFSTLFMSNIDYITERKIETIFLKHNISASYLFRTGQFAKLHAYKFIKKNL